MKSFIENYELLRENHKVDDLLDLSETITSFSNKIDTLKSPGLMGMVGGFGKGKSTLLHNISKQRQEKEVWMEFEAWKFPDRKDLWECFVLEFARQIDKKTFEEARKGIDGKTNIGKKVFIDTLSCIPLPGFPAIKNLNHFLETSPARRTFEIQEILNKIIKEKAKENIFIVIEDIDRSGDAGIFFLETLRQYLKSLEHHKKIIVVVPIAEENYYKNQNSYFKCLDYIDFFNAPKPKLYKFVEAVFSEDLIKEAIHKRQIVSFLELLFNLFPEPTMRQIKLILRKADINYQNQQKDGLDPDWRVSILFEAAKYFKEHSSSKGSYFESFKEDYVVRNNSIFSALLFAILNNNKELIDCQGKIIRSLRQFKLINKKGDDGKQNFPSIPWSTNYPPDDKNRYLNCDFYLNY